MANKTRGEYRLELGGSERTLRFRFQQLGEIDGLVGGIMSAFEEKRIFQLAQAAILVGLRHEDRRITPDKVGRWFDEEDAPLEVCNEVVSHLLDALNIGDDEESEPEASKPAKKAKAGT